MAAKVTAQEHGNRAQTLVAAKLWREVRGAKVKLDALVEQRTQLQQQLRPQLEEVQKRALSLNAAFGEAIEAAQLAFEEAKEREATILANLTKERDELGTLKDEHSSLSADLSDIQSRIDLANRARERLVADRVIQLREEAVDAETRLTAEVSRLENVGKACRAQAVEARSRATAHREQSARLSNLAAQARNLAEQARADVARFEAARDACTGLDCVKEILEGGPFDPFNKGVVEALRACYGRSWNRERCCVINKRWGWGGSTKNWLSS
jgi:chromosome segregation ATPase